jgi:hypothetical protein
MEISMEFPQKTKIDLPYTSAMLLLHMFEGV